jgi:MerR family transcriptional regulator/heat shock protein HspR
LEKIGMARKYLRITEVVEICGVDEAFVKRLEREHVIRATNSQNRKLYSLDQVDRVRVARLLIEEMGVNLEGTEVVLHMREQMITMQRQVKELLRRLNETKNSARRRT